MTVLIREVATGLHVRDDGDGRTLFGPLIPWGVEASVLDRGRMVVETFQRGPWLARTRPGSRSPPATPATTKNYPSGSGSSWKNAPTPRGAPGGSPRRRSATRSWSWPATACRSGCRSVSMKSLVVTAGLPIVGG